MSTVFRAALTAVISAIEAAAVALASFVVIAVPILLVWWLEFDLGTEPGEMVAGAAGGWLLVHLVPLNFAIGPEAALGFGLDPVTLSFTVSLAPLGVTVLTVALAARAGWRLAVRGGAGAVGLLGGFVGFSVFAWVAATLGASFRAWSLWPAILVPALCYGVSAAAAYLLHSATRGDAWWLGAVRAVQRGLERLLPARGDGVEPSFWVAALPTRAAEVVRLAAGSVAGLLGLGALAVASALVVGYVDIVTLSQGLQLDWLGMLALLLLNLALLPVACVWAVAWLTGTGFAVGAVTSVSPFETLLGPLPAFPLFGALPQGWGWAGGLAPALVVLVAVGVGALAGRRTALRHGSLATSIVIPLLAAALAGLALAGLAALAAGAIGPERLAIAGPKPWHVGGLAAIEIAVGLVPGVLARRLDTEQLRAGWADRVAAPGDSGYVEDPSRAVSDPESVPGSMSEPVSEITPESAPGPTPGRGPSLRRVPSPLLAPIPEPVPESEPARTVSPATDAASSDESGDESTGEPRDETGAEPRDEPRDEQEELLRAFSWESGGPSVDEGSGERIGEGATEGADEGARGRSMFRKWRVPRRRG